MLRNLKALYKGKDDIFSNDFDIINQLFNIPGVDDPIVALENQNLKHFCMDQFKYGNLISGYVDNTNITLNALKLDLVQKYYRCICLSRSDIIRFMKLIDLDSLLKELFYIVYFSVPQHDCRGPLKLKNQLSGINLDNIKDVCVYIPFYRLIEYCIENPKEIKNLKVFPKSHILRKNYFTVKRCITSVTIMKTINPSYNIIRFIVDNMHTRMDQIEKIPNLNLTNEIIGLINEDRDGIWYREYLVNYIIKHFYWHIDIDFLIHTVLGYGMNLSKGMIKNLKCIDINQFSNEELNKILIYSIEYHKVMNEIDIIRAPNFTILNDEIIYPLLENKSKYDKLSTDYEEMITFILMNLHNPYQLDSDKLFRALCYVWSDVNMAISVERLVMHTNFTLTAEMVKNIYLYTKVVIQDVERFGIKN